MATPTSLPASFSAGAVLTAAQMNNLRGAFRVLQLKQMTYNTQTTVNTSTWTDTGLTDTITPSATSSKILVVANVNGTIKGAEDAQNALMLKIVRGSTDVYNAGEVNYTNSAVLLLNSATLIYLDSPSTTSSTTYKVAARNVRNGSTVGYCWQAVNSSLTLLEISA